MVGPDVDDRIELVAKRIDFLEALADAPQHKPGLVESLGHSRSTVDRAIRRLESVGFVERTDEGFRATLAGRRAAERYRAFLAEMTTVLDGAEFLGSLPPDCDLPLDAVRAGRAGEFATPSRAFEAVVEPLRTADRYVAFLPRLRDSRHLRLCHARVRTDGMDADLLVTADVLERLRTEFPRLAADLALADGVTVRRVDDPRPYALVLAAGDETTVSVTPADGDATRVLTATAQPAVAWVEETLASLRADATDVTDGVAALADDLDETLLGRHERRGPSSLAELGVERLDSSYFSEQTPNDPATGWRIGFDLVDVYYGHPFERRHQPADAAPRATDRESDETETEARPRAVDHLVDALTDGGNRAVLGSAGSGKTTLCRQVACRWVADGRGPVFYRETPADTAFDRPEVLTAALDEADGHALVVVEDGVDEATVDRLAGVLERARDDPEVSILLEARATDWPPPLADPHDENVLRAVATEYRLDELRAPEVRDAVAAFEAATGRDVPLSGDELFETIRAGDGPGDCYLLGYLLAAHTTPAPWSDAATEPTGLDADARDGYAVVAPDGPDDETIPLEVGLLAALLAASEQSVTSAALHTVAVAHAGDEAEEARTSAHRRVDAAIDDLRGTLLFDQADGDAFRTQHPYWAVRFLEAALDDEERTTVNAFERALSALFAPADDPTIRERIEAWLGRSVDGFDRFETGIDGLVGAVFDVVRSYASLVPLFGTTELSGITLPDACVPETRLATQRARLYGWYKYGELDRARAEAERLLGAVAAADVDAATAARFEVLARRRLADVADDRGDPEPAREHLRAGLSVARDADDRRAETRLLTSLGMVELHADEYDAAERYLTEADDVGEPLGACPERSATKYYLGRLHRKRGEYDAAEADLREALEFDRQCELPLSDEAATFNALGTVAADRGAFDRAEAYYRQALERQREANNRRGVATTLVNLGDLAVETEEVDVAESCFEAALDAAADIEAAVVHGAALGGLGQVATARGDYERAERLHRERTTVDDSPRTSAIATRNLGDVAAERGDPDVACDRYEEAFEAFAEVGAVDRAVTAALRLVETYIEAGETTAARTWADRARELAADAELTEHHDEAAAWEERLTSN